MDTMVTVSDLTDHPSKAHSLIFVLFVPLGGGNGTGGGLGGGVGGAGTGTGVGMGDGASVSAIGDRVDRAAEKRWNVELEFEFDLLTDDALSIILEMKDCEELSSARIDADQITRMFAPFLKAASRQLAVSAECGSSLGLARAVINEVGNSDWVCVCVFVCVYVCVNVYDYVCSCLWVGSYVYMCGCLCVSG